MGSRLAANSAIEEQYRRLWPKSAEIFRFTPQEVSCGLVFTASTRLSLRPSSEDEEAQTKGSHLSQTEVGCGVVRSHLLFLLGDVSAVFPCCQHSLLRLEKTLLLALRAHCRVPNHISCPVGRARKGMPSGDSGFTWDYPRTHSQS